MKKSILFSSIATTCCLLIQHSASAGWNYNESDRLEAGMNGLYLVSNTNEWGSNSVALSKQGAESRSSSEFGLNTFQSSSIVSSHGADSYSDTCTSKETAQIIFAITEASNINLNFYCRGSGGWINLGSHGESSSGIWFQLDRQDIAIGSAWNMVASTGTGGSANRNYPSYESNGSETFYLTPGPFNYRISIEISNESHGNMSDAETSFNMSLTPVPAPAASALLALAGLVSRRRKA